MKKGKSKMEMAARAAEGVGCRIADILARIARNWDYVAAARNEDDFLTPRLREAVAFLETAALLALGLVAFGGNRLAPPEPVLVPLVIRRAGRR